MNQEHMDELTGLAMILREEQVQARIVHYKAELETNEELDAITAGVVAQLKQLQTKVAASKGPEDIANVEREQKRTLANLLGRVFRPDSVSVLIEQCVKETSRRVTRMFFESELHERITANAPKLKTIHHAEQGLFYVLSRYENRMKAELEGFAYEDDEVKEATLELLQRTANDLRVAFLSRRSPEVKRLLSACNQVLLVFFQKDMPKHLDEMAAQIVNESGSAKTNGAVAYKILHASFPDFRKAFEKAFLTHMIEFCEPRLVSRLEESEEAFRDDTIAFVQMPQLYSDVCEVVSEGLYDFLCNEGFLDLPIDWRDAARRPK